MTFPVNTRLGRRLQKTDFESEFNGNIAVDALEKRPEMVILWADMLSQKDYLHSTGTHACH